MIDGLTSHERIATGNRHGAQIVRVHEINVPAVSIQHVHIVDESIVDVDYVDECMAAGEPRKKRFTPAQREPAHAKAESKAPASAEEADECRAIARRTKIRSRAPTPRAADECPAAIVIWGKTPGLVAYPGPTPRSDPGPIAVAVGRPVRPNVIGIPDISVDGLIASSPIIIDVVVTGHVARNVVS